MNTALSTFTYTPAPGFLGLARIVFEIDDQGNTGPELPPNVLARTRFIDIDVVAASADLAVSKTGPLTGVAGTNLTYGLTITNDGPALAADVVLADAVPAGTTFVSAGQSTGSPFTLSTPAVGGTGTVTATIAALPAGGSATFSLVVGSNADVAAGSTQSPTRRRVRSPPATQRPRTTRRRCPR